MNSFNQKHIFKYFYLLDIENSFNQNLSSPQKIAFGNWTDIKQIDDYFIFPKSSLSKNSIQLLLKPQKKRISLTWSFGVIRKEFSQRTLDAQYAKLTKHSHYFSPLLSLPFTPQWKYRKNIFFSKYLKNIFLYAAEEVDEFTWDLLPFQQSLIIHDQERLQKLIEKKFIFIDKDESKGITLYKHKVFENFWQLTHLSTLLKDSREQEIRLDQVTSSQWTYEFVERRELKKRGILTLDIDLLDGAKLDHRKTPCEINNCSQVRMSGSSFCPQHHYMIIKGELED